MKDIPILFSGVMIRALLAGRKTNSRRMSEQWMKVKAGDRLWVRETWCAEYECDGNPPPFSDGRPILRTPADLTDCEWGHLPAWEQMHYRATDKAPDLDCRREGCRRAGDPHCHWSPSIHMPRWASRITLEATEDARRESLVDISEADAIAEGIWGKVLPASFGMPESMAYYWGSKETSDLGGGFDHARQAFHCLWDSINGKTAPVSSNPVPVRLAFRVVA